MFGFKLKKTRQIRVKIKHKKDRRGGIFIFILGRGEFLLGMTRSVGSHILLFFFRIINQIKVAKNEKKETIIKIYVGLICKFI